MLILTWADSSEIVSWSWLPWPAWNQYNAHVFTVYVYIKFTWFFLIQPAFSCAPIPYNTSDKDHQASLDLTSLTATDSKYMKCTAIVTLASHDWTKAKNNSKLVCKSGIGIQTTLCIYAFFKVPWGFSHVSALSFNVFWERGKIKQFCCYHDDLCYNLPLCAA